MNWKEEFRKLWKYEAQLAGLAKEREVIESHISTEIIENLILEAENKYRRHTWTSERDAEFVFHVLGQLRDKWLWQQKNNTNLKRFQVAL